LKNTKSDNPYQKQARYKKAVAVVDILEVNNFEDIDLLDDNDRANIESLAGVKKLSEESWEIVKSLYKKRASGPF
jgi:c-di-AMP phosphodiesterase-like protein